MSIGVTCSAKLNELVTSLWSSPVFGNSFPAQISKPMLTRINRIYQHCADDLLAILAHARPDLDSHARRALVDQIAPKSVAFCGILAADEVDDPERCAATAIATALVYLGDQTIDRGDEVMLWVLERLSHTEHLRRQGAPSRGQAERYLALLGGMVEQVNLIARPEDRFELLHLLMNDTLVREARVLRLNQIFLQEDVEIFWNQYAEEFAEQIVMNAGFIAVASMNYSVLRHTQPQLPSLALVLSSDPTIAAALKAGSAACRIFDEVGDRVIDQGNTRWGKFCVNPCNQRDPRFLNALCDSMGMNKSEARKNLLSAFYTEDFSAVIEQTKAFVREQYAAIPTDLKKEYGTFLRISQRVLEAGWVNLIGDEQLMDNLGNYHKAA
ncbi:hypothetical protein [Candidatus Oscillochloris fontis]|uniref:hypothetical protein n=1 Tax=Candidatus Oscillochloris fontis TaxID=2496868 RepID=UPI00101DDB4E|nr:hypothetical protein [Candidatus Oscillochloris fontis]